MGRWQLQIVRCRKILSSTTMTWLAGNAAGLVTRCLVEEDDADGVTPHEPLQLGAATKVSTYFHGGSICPIRI